VLGDSGKDIYCRCDSRSANHPKRSDPDIAFGTANPKVPMKVLSLMPENGVIFSDGIESDFLTFNSGIEATVSVSKRVGRLIQQQERKLRQLNT
jgi:hypothetical protein